MPSDSDSNIDCSYMATVVPCTMTSLTLQNNLRSKASTYTLDDFPHHFTTCVLPRNRRHVDVGSRREWRRGSQLRQTAGWHLLLHVRPHAQCKRATSSCGGRVVVVVVVVVAAQQQQRQRRRRWQQQQQQQCGSIGGGNSSCVVLIVLLLVYLLLK